jgi:hypothetical protein
MIALPTRPDGPQALLLSIMRQALADLQSADDRQRYDARRYFNSQLFEHHMTHLGITITPAAARRGIELAHGVKMIELRTIDAVNEFVEAYAKEEKIDYPSALRKLLETAPWFRKEFEKVMLAPSSRGRPLDEVLKNVRQAYWATDADLTIKAHAAANGVDYGAAVAALAAAGHPSIIKYQETRR